MKRILIVDDEYLVRLGLKTIIDWNEHGYSIAGEASNGREALEIFDRVGADVILTDIKMPVMDGLELTRAIKEKDKKVKIIILSHYDEFAYAQEAINLGAFRYILKSELTRAGILGVLKSIFHTVSEESGEAEEKTGHGALNAEWERYIETYLLPFFQRTQAIDPCPPLPKNSALTEERFIIISAACRLTALLHDATKMFPKTVKVLFAEAFGNSTSAAIYHHEEFELVSIVPVLTGSTRPDSKIVESCIRIVKNIHQYYDANLFIGLSSTGSENEMSRLFYESRTALELCFFSEKNFTESFHGEKSESRLIPPHISYSKLSRFVENNQKKEMLDYIQEVFQCLRKNRNNTMVHNAFIDFLSIGKTIREKYQMQEQAFLNESKFNYNIFHDLLFIGDVELYIYGLFLTLLAGKQGGEVTYSYIVKKCIAFIQQNYTKNITLSDAALNAGVSHSYLSFIFKHETGINFNTCLSQYRVDEAKRLLQSTNMRIYEVAEKVGFSNPYYFSKVFKEFTGMSCKEYRDAAPPDG
jgi:two-component system response regulator YesN